MFDRIREKLNILADAAKYDVSCSSSGSKRKNTDKGLGLMTPDIKEAILKEKILEMVWVTPPIPAYVILTLKMDDAFHY